jgi:hypothetical protein
MKRNNIIGGIFFLVVGLFFATYSRSVEIGEWSEPGPGFLPFYGGLLMAGMSVLLLVGSFLRAQEAAEPFFPESDSWKRVLGTFLALVAYNLLLRPLGFPLVTFLFVGKAFWVSERRAGKRTSSGFYFKARRSLYNR